MRPLADREPLLARTPSGHNEATLIKNSAIRIVIGGCVTDAYPSFDARPAGDLNGIT